MELVTTLFTMGASLKKGKMEQQQFEMQAAQGEIAATDEAIRGKDEAMVLRRQMLEVSSSINAATAASGMIASSGSADGARIQARAKGQKEILTSRSSTKRRILERQFTAAQARGRGIQARTAGYAKAIGTGLKTAASIQRRGTII